MNAPVERGLLGQLRARDATALRYLMPGEWWFGTDAAMVSTLLGSCVSVTLWHPQRRVGGMCHFLLPGRARAPGQALDGRFGDEAIELLLRAIAGTHTRPAEYHVHVAGGANMFPTLANITLDIGARNADEAVALLDHHGFVIADRDTGGTRHRRVELDMSNGRVSVRAGA